MVPKPSRRAVQVSLIRILHTARVHQITSAFKYIFLNLEVLNLERTRTRTCDQQNCNHELSKIELILPEPMHIELVHF